MLPYRERQYPTAVFGLHGVHQALHDSKTCHYDHPETLELEYMSATRSLINHQDIIPGIIGVVEDILVRVGIGLLKCL